MNSFNKLNLAGKFTVAMPFFYQLDNILNTTYFYKIGFFSALCLTFVNYRRKFIFHSFFMKILICVASVYVIIPVIGFSINFDGILYAILSIAFLGVLFISGNQMYKERRRYLEGLLLSNSIILIAKILENISEINKTNIMRILDSNLYQRADFGFSHPNFAAMFIVVEILILYYVSKLTKKKFLTYIFILLFIFPLLATGSRTAVLSVLYFAFSEVVIKSNFRRTLFSDFLYRGLVIFVIGLVFILSKDSLNEISSGRSTLLKDNIKIVVDSGKFLLGFGGMSTSSIRDIAGVSFSDNWYVSIFLRYGIVGLLIMFLLYVYIYNFFSKNFLLKRSSLSLIGMIGIYSIAENVLFTPGVSLSFLVWTIVISNRLSIMDCNKSEY